MLESVNNLSLARIRIDALEGEVSALAGERIDAVAVQCPVIEIAGWRSVEDLADRSTGDRATPGARIARDKIGTFDTELVQEWFQAFAMNAGITLHVETLYGTNDHHISESCFKGLARALRAAVAIDPRAKDEVPSTKGSLGG